MEEQLQQKQTQKKGVRTIKEISLSAMFVALMAVCSWINITIIPPVPFTLQVLAVFATLLFLGGFRGSIAISIYVLMGLIGLPVFSNFEGGMAKLVGPTGGYIFGFVAVALLYWLFEAILGKSKHWIWIKILVLVFGLFVLYAIGTWYFIFAFAKQGKAFTLYKALSLCVIPFIPADLAKLGIALLLYNRLKRFVRFDR